MENQDIGLLGNSELLTREKMRKIAGGDGGINPPPPPTGEEGKGFKCCWAGTNNCSACIEDALPDWKCSPGASLIAC